MPVLAESWQTSDDAMEWTFTLRDGVTFHDGTPLNSAAVIANYERWRKVSPKGSPFNVLNIEQSYPGLVEVRAIDERRFSFVFNASRPTLPYSIMNYSSPIYAPSSFDKDGNFNSKAIGTGPFRIVERNPEVKVVLEANPNYWGQRAKSQRISIATIPDADTRLSALRAGEVVGLIGTGSLPADRAAELLQDPRFRASSAISTSVHHVVANGRSSVFSDARLRKAVSLAIDRSKIAELYSGYVVPTQNILNVTSPFYRHYEIQHDPIEAERIASEALDNKRTPVRLLVGTFGTSRYPYRAQAEYIQFALRPLGLDVEVQVLDTSTFFAALSKGQYELALSIQMTANADPYSLFKGYMSSEGSSNAALSLGYANAEVDALLERAEAAHDIAARRDIYEALQAIAVDTFPTIPLFTEKNLVAFDARITGYSARIHDTTLPSLHLAD
ncbi:ABC transporter substrate-binding protein [Hyphomicrobium sulfonivorans]|uniref:ABC transporter substrate-binding protein n=1 Tax=Hyphomicrobium sulfonivorans TaxID=121290 RepID=UPI0018DDCFC1|nr:ABC transporter substrate-binding protein [Hyphomicrobium sulfonivorans]